MSDTKTVHAAWADVMGDVRALDKGDRNQQQGFNFRGVDAVMNAVGPALRRHGVTVAPTGVTGLTASTYTTKSGTVMRDVTLVVSYAITGPAGDTMPGAAAGEASDAGDKAVPKAMSVAYRTFLLQSLCLPTHEADPDAQSYERGTGPTPAQQAQDTADRLADCTDLETVRRVQSWAEQRRLMDEQVTDAQGNTLSLGQLFTRVAEVLQGSDAA
jgi:hypothetical protein